jgi:hypothetical protein
MARQRVSLLPRRSARRLRVEYGAGLSWVDFRHCRLKEAIALELGNELLVRDGGLTAALGYDGQIFQIFEQFLVIGNRKNDGSAFAVVVGNVFNRLAH